MCGQALRAESMPVHQCCPRRPKIAHTTCTTPASSTAPLMIATCGTGASIRRPTAAATMNTLRMIGAEAVGPNRPCTCSIAPKIATMHTSGMYGSITIINRTAR